MKYLFLGSIISIVLIIALIKSYLFKSKPCIHPNLVEWKWVKNGTCMFGQECRNCGFYNQYQVPTNPETWMEE